MFFIRYWTKCDLPAGDQFLTFSPQWSIFGHIGDQLVTILSTEQIIWMLYYFLSHTTEYIKGAILNSMNTLPK